MRTTIQRNQRRRSTVCRNKRPLSTVRPAASLGIYGWRWTNADCLNCRTLHTRCTIPRSYCTMHANSVATLQMHYIMHVNAVATLLAYCTMLCTACTTTLMRLASLTRVLSVPEREHCLWPALQLRNSYHAAIYITIQLKSDHKYWHVATRYVAQVKKLNQSFLTIRNTVTREVDLSTMHSLQPSVATVGVHAAM